MRLELKKTERRLDLWSAEGCWKPLEARVALSFMMLTSSTIANSLNIARSWASVMCLGTCPTKSLTLSSLAFRGLGASAINAGAFSLYFLGLSLSIFSLFPELLFNFSLQRESSLVENSLGEMGNFWMAKLDLHRYIVIKCLKIPLILIITTKMPLRMY